MLLMALFIFLKTNVDALKSTCYSPDVRTGEALSLLVAVTYETVSCLNINMFTAGSEVTLP